MDGENTDQRQPAFKTTYGEEIRRLANTLGEPTRTYITRANRDAIRIALEDFQKILHEIGAIDSLDATSRIKMMAKLFGSKYKKLFDRIVNMAGDDEIIPCDDIEIVINQQTVDIDG